MFSFACIYDSWIDESKGERKNTFSILTCPANSLMENIHNKKKRMPVILSIADEKRWLNPSLTKKEINSLIAPYDEKDMIAYTVSKKLNSAKNNRNVPESLEKVEYKQITLF